MMRAEPWKSPALLAPAESRLCESRCDSAACRRLRNRHLGDLGWMGAREVQGELDRPHESLVLT